MSLQVSVLGLGYLGATQAIVLAEMGHTVLGVDPDPRKVSSLREGRLPFYEPGLQDLLNKANLTGRLTFETDYSEKLRDPDIHFLCVGTPALNNEGDVDLSAIFDAGTSLAKFIKENSVIVGRSTVPVGTAAKLTARISDVAQVPFSLAWNPEFLSEGSAISDSINPSRIVVGADSDLAVAALRQIYKPQIDHGVPFLLMDIPSSELVKVASNSFLAMKISYINGVAEIAEKSGASTQKLAEAMGLDPRIGKLFLRNGLGFGGGCLPKDLQGFMKTADTLNALGMTKLLSAAGQINADRIRSTVELAKDCLANLHGKNVSILGIAFKPDTDDIRDSPGLKLAKSFKELGSIVAIHDPISGEEATRGIDIEIQRDIDRVVNQADLVVVATDWPEYSHFEPTPSSALPERFVIDGRSVIQTRLWRAAGWKVITLGEAR